jgi:predicted dehydrogenase/threonine dehydrogenase-like Zn-dependent dehydrogenase
VKQVVQNYNTGELRLADVPAPICRAGGVLVRTAYSLVSSGTERMKVSQARMSLWQKAKARPDKVKQVLQSVRQVGLRETYNKVKERLDSLTPLGYSLAGYVEEVGAGLDDFEPGQAVACAGEGIACHAEYVFVPRNLCVPVPAGVALPDAAFATVGAIAIQGVRQANVGLGDSVLVIGLGLLGLLGVQILKAAGCRVIGVDVDPAKCELARKLGADLAIPRGDPAIVDTLHQATGGAGVDAAYVAASANTSDPLDLAGEALRDRGTVCIVGMVKVAADWRVYYAKELNVVMSRSYGPGRYDRNYEFKGIDYPIGYVRWTQRRNLAEFLRLVQQKAVRPAELMPKVVPFANAPVAYDELNKGGSKAAVAFLFDYGAGASTANGEEPARRVELAAGGKRNAAVHAAPASPHTAPASGHATPVGIAMIGAGNFTTGTLIPALKHTPARLVALCSAGGLSATSAGERHGFSYVASDFEQVLADPAVNAVVIATRHDTHARFAAAAMRAGKHVFVEKPLALNEDQLRSVLAAQAETGRILMPGFNRRFSALSVAARDAFLGRAGPIEINCRVNAGELKADSWYQDAEEGGWRIVSEGCHWVDLIQFIADSPVVRVYAEMVGGSAPGRQNDNIQLSLRLADGSIANLMYVANGDASFEKERIEIFGRGCVGVIENWHKLTMSRHGKISTVRPPRPGKGHAEELAAFVDAVARGGPSPISVESAAITTLTTFGAVRSAARHEAVEVAFDADRFLKAEPPAAPQEPSQGEPLATAAS